MRNPILAEFVERRGATKRIAEACGVTHAAVSQWKSVPAKHVATVAALIGTTPDALRTTHDAASNPANEVAA